MKVDRSKRRSLYDYDQPFDLFEEFDRGSDETNLLRNSDNRQYKILFLAGFFIAVVISGFAFLGLINRAETKSPFVLLELRAINESGHPVAGADVYLGKRKFGLTDSFGEWRRYLRLKSGRKILVTMKKSNDGVILVAKKEVFVPLNDDDELEEPEIKMTLELRPKFTRKTKKLASYSDSRRNYITDVPANLIVAPKVEGLLESEPRARVQQRHSRVASLPDSGSMNSIDIKALPFQNRFGTMMEEHQAKVLNVKVVPEMIGLAYDDGLEIKKNADIHLKLAYLPYKGHVGLIKADVHWRDNAGKEIHRQFLGNFAKTIIETAENLLRVAKTHVNRGYLVYRQESSWVLGEEGLPQFWAIRHGQRLMNADRRIFTISKNSVAAMIQANGNPCPDSHDSCVLKTPSNMEMSPNLGWTKHSFRFDQDLPPDAEVFVEGFEAVFANGQYSYWGQSDKHHSLTILSEGQIFYLGSLVPSESQYSMISLPGVMTHH